LADQPCDQDVGTYDPLKVAQQLHQAVADELLERIQGGDAKPADIAAAVKFLRDNNIDCQAVRGTPIFELAENLPFDEEGRETG